MGGENLYKLYIFFFLAYLIHCMLLKNRYLRVKKELYIFCLLWKGKKMKVKKGDKKEIKNNFK